MRRLRVTCQVLGCLALTWALWFETPYPMHCDAGGACQSAPREGYNRDMWERDPETFETRESCNQVRAVRVEAFQARNAELAAQQRRTDGGTTRLGSFHICVPEGVEPWLGGK